MILGFPISAVPFTCALLLNLLVCYLMIRGYDWGMVGREEPTNKTNKNVETTKEEEAVFIAIV
jgi:hypothetical protein